MVSTFLLVISLIENECRAERCAQAAHLGTTGGQSILPLSVIQVSSGHTTRDGYTARDGLTTRDGHTAPGRGGQPPLHCWTVYLEILAYGEAVRQLMKYCQGNWVL